MMYALLFLFSLLSHCLSEVVELGPTFGDASDLVEPHLVMFYAPWCGHCRTLHPTWYELGSKLARQPITVAKIDATIYRSAAEKYGVRGFPTIRLISKDRVLEYNGERTTDALIKFATKGSRPLISSVASQGKLNDLKNTGDVVFLAVGDTAKSCLEALAPGTVNECVFGDITNDALVPLSTSSALPSAKSSPVSSVRPDLSVSKLPGLLALKDGLVIEYTEDVSDCEGVRRWVMAERFNTFIIGSYPSIHPLLFLKYKLVFYYGENEGRIREMKELASGVSEMYLVHVTKAEYIENLVVASVEVESTIIFDPVTEEYSLFPGDSSISRCLEQWPTAPRYGGTGVLASSKKVLYRIYSNVAPLFSEHPFVMGMICVIPIGLMLLCCCDENRSKDDPIRQIRSDVSQMDLLWGDDDDKKKIEDEEETEEVEEEKEEEIKEIEPEEKDPTLKKDE